MPERFIVAASTCESARLLLNSALDSLSQMGWPNSSGVVGRYLMDSVGSWGSGYFPQLEKMPPHNHDGVGGNYPAHVYSVVEVRSQERISARLSHRTRWWPLHACGRAIRRCMRPVRGATERHSSKTAAARTAPRSASEALGEMIPNPNILTANSIPVRSMSGVFRCCVFIGDPATTKSKWRKICRKPSAPSSRPRADLLYRNRFGRSKSVTAST